MQLELKCLRNRLWDRGWDGARTLLRSLSDFLDVSVAAQRFGANRVFFFWGWIIDLFNLWVTMIAF